MPGCNCNKVLTGSSKKVFDLAQKMTDLDGLKRAVYHHLNDEYRFDLIENISNDKIIIRTMSNERIKYKNKSYKKSKFTFEFFKAINPSATEKQYESLTGCKLQKNKNENKVKGVKKPESKNKVSEE